MSATVAAALKKIAVAILTDKKALKTVGGIILGILIIICLPVVSIVSILNGDIQFDEARLQQIVVQNLSAEEQIRLQAVEDTMYAIDTAMRDRGFDAVREGLEHSEDGRWAVSYEELLYHFGVDVSDTNENGKLLEEELRQREEINELIMTEDCIEMTYHLEYCENCQGDPDSLLSVLGCNLTEDHFDHGPVQSM